MNKVNSIKRSIFLLTGFMGAGKSYFGKLISNRLSFDYIDLDEYIERKESCSIKDMILLKGEDYFRKIESKHFESIIEQSQNNLIIASGGGLPLRVENQNLMKKVTSIFIDTDFDLILERLNNEEKSKRPLLASLGLEGIKKLYNERFYIYKRTADFTSHDFNEILDFIIKEGRRNE